MKRNLLHLFIVALALLAVSPAFGQRRAKKLADKDMKNWRYEIECVNVSSDGSYIIKIFTFSKNKNVAITQASKNAVHGVIFRGIPQNEVGCVSQPPLARHPNAQEKNREFFEDFFSDTGDFQKFVTLTTNGAVAPEDRLKVGKKEYKIGVIVSVDVASLRKTLEAAGVIKGLSSGF
jgi:hypothetical protein